MNNRNWINVNSPFLTENATDPDFSYRGRRVTFHARRRDWENLTSDLIGLTGPATHKAITKFMEEKLGIDPCQENRAKVGRAVQITTGKTITQWRAIGLEILIPRRAVKRAAR